MKTNGGVLLNSNEGLEDWLKKNQCDDFPKYSHERGEKSYPERYEEIKNALKPIHNIVTVGAMQASIASWFDEAKDEIAKINACSDSKTRAELMNTKLESDSTIYLNNHGCGHVEKVIEKVSEMLQYFTGGHLNAYEGFLLLCAIQLHDVGNIFGRSKHEKRIRDILDSTCKPFLHDSIERRVIEKIAMTHSGKIYGDKDTISKLSISKTLFDRKIRKRLLAALLRFGDELADDSSRADQQGLDLKIISSASQIYHYYSRALHTVNISRNAEDNDLQLNLSYEFDSDIASQQFEKFGDQRYLLDEIYDRTLKIEQERRYCMRFLRPYFSIEKIRVEIIIQDSLNTFNTDVIQYTLEESGYPLCPSCGSIKDILSQIRSGEEEVKYLELNRRVS